jgi:hypothetical protein
MFIYTIFIYTIFIRRSKSPSALLRLGAQQGRITQPSRIAIRLCWVPLLSWPVAQEGGQLAAMVTVAISPSVQKGGVF